MVGYLTTLTSAVATLSQAQLAASPVVGATVSAPPTSVSSPLGERPPWAAGCVDARRVLTWDSEQYIANVVVNRKVLTLCIVDTGSC